MNGDTITQNRVIVENHVGIELYILTDPAMIPDHYARMKSRPRTNHTAFANGHMRTNADISCQFDALVESLRSDECREKAAPARDEVFERWR